MAARTALVIAIVLLACPAAFDAAGPARPPVTHTVTMDAARFQPATLTIRAGDTVVWVNKDFMPHTASAQGFDSGTVASGKSWKHTFKAKGEFPYVCVFHPTMKASLRVK